MKHIFLDTDLLIDLLADREPFADLALRLFIKSAEGVLKLYVSASSFNNIYYIIRKLHSHKKALELLTSLEQRVKVLGIEDTVIRNVLLSGFNDFEDAIQHFCAISHPEIEAIVTRNLKDFKKSTLPVFHPQEVLRLVE